MSTHREETKSPAQLLKALEKQVGSETGLEADQVSEWRQHRLSGDDLSPDEGDNSDEAETKCSCQADTIDCWGSEDVKADSDEGTSKCARQADTINCWGSEMVKPKK